MKDIKKEVKGIVELVCPKINKEKLIKSIAEKKEAKEKIIYK